RFALEGHAEGRNWVAFSPDARLLVSGSFDNTAKLWDVTTGKEVATLPGHTGRVRSARFTPDGKLLITASTDGTLRVWDVASRKRDATLSPSEGHGESAGALAAVRAPDGRAIAVAAETKAVLLRELHTGKILRTLQGHGDAVTCLAYAPDGRLLATAGPD